jgi:hypothetical protein
MTTWYSNRPSFAIRMRRRMALAVSLAFLLSACSDSPPPMATGLPKSFGPTPDFDIRIKQRFPIGSDEGNLLTELRVERFVIVESHDPAIPYKRSALYENHNFPCKETWSIQWTADKGKITEMVGR